MKKILCLLTLISLCFVFISCGTRSEPVATEGLEYRLLDDGTYEVSGIGTASELDIVIPAAYNGAAVTSIGYNAFYGCYNIKSVTIEDGVKTIGAGAFSDCASITSITLPDTLQSIGSDAFRGCSPLAYNEYNNALYIGSARNPYLALVSAKSTDTVSCKINKNAKFICSSAFYLCASLTSVEIPSGITHIGAHAFQGCASLASVKLPADITIIEDETFTGCTSLKSITVPRGVVSIGTNAFTGCSSLASVSLPDTLTTINICAFSNCRMLTNVYIPESVTAIGAHAFEYCSALARIECEAQTAGENWAVDWLGDCKATVTYGVNKK